MPPPLTLTGTEATPSPLTLTGTEATPPPLTLTDSLSLPQPVLNQAGLPQGPSDQKVVVVTVDNCDTSVAVRFGGTIGNYSCAAQGSQSGSKK